MAAPAPVNMTTFENTIYSWFRDQTGLTNVRWADQDYPQTRYPFGLITPLTGMQRVQNAFDGFTAKTNLANPAGEEVEITHEGHREISISFQAWVGPPDNNNPAKNARDFLSRAQGSLNLLTVRGTFDAANIGVIEDLGITKLDRVIEDVFVSIANMDVRFMVASSVLEKTGYINILRTDGTIKNIDGNTIESFVDKDFGNV